MLLSPEEFARAWGPDALVRLPRLAEEPIPSESHEFLVRAGLPALIRYFPDRDDPGSTEAVITFCRLASGLSPVLGEKTVGPALPSEWSVYWIVGDEFFCNGAKWWCVHGPTGRVDRIDIQIEPPVKFVNSSVMHFASAILTASVWSARCRRTVEEWPSELDELEGVLQAFDPACMGSTENFWPVCLAFLRSEGPQLWGFEKGSRAEGEEALRAGPW
jgi:SUKH-4 immunity protein